jgi:hypothetical protein
MNIKVLPLILSPSSVLNSLWSFINSIFHAIVCREGINHILIGINIILRNVLVQLIDIFIILVDGSNTENKFARVVPHGEMLRHFTFITEIFTQCVPRHLRAPLPSRAVHSSQTGQYFITQGILTPSRECHGRTQ